MMSDIEAGNVNCVIVKDLSRLGRDYIEAGRLIQKTFPVFHVRFIALTDNFDSMTADFHTTSLIVPVKNFINDSYCRDISQKVRSQQRIKRQQGKFIGAFTVYGYQKSECDRNKLCPDEYAAEVVRKIFSWKLGGMSAAAIADRLNGLGILSPMAYKLSRGENYSTGFRTGVDTRWSSVAIKRILKNEIYTGVLIQGKEECINYKVKKQVTKPREEWVRVENTHEAIIAREDFDTVQRLLQVDTRAGKGNSRAHLFAGLLFCGDCKEPMVRRVNRYKDREKIYFICQTKNREGKCTRHSIAENELRAVVFHTLKTYAEMFLDVNDQLENIQRMEIDVTEIGKFDREMEQLCKKKEKFGKLRLGLYEDMKKGILTETDYRNFSRLYEQQYKEAEASISHQKKFIESLHREGVISGIRLEQFKEALQLTELDRDTLLTFVHRIDVYEERKLYIELRGKPEFEKIPLLQEYMAKKKQREGEFHGENF